MYHSNQYLLEPYEEQNLVHYYSFVKKPQLDRRNSNLRKERKNKTQMTVSNDDLNDTVPFNRSSFAYKKPFSGQKQSNHDDYSFKELPSPALENRSSIRNSVRPKSSLDDVELKSVSVLSSAREQKTGAIYQQIIQVVQKENHNLKEHNRFLINQYKKIQTQNTFLKEKNHYFNSQQLENLKIENSKLREMIKAYQKQIEQLKHVLLQEMVSLHQKFNLIIAEQQGSVQKMNQFASELKYSEAFTRNSAYFNKSRDSQNSRKNVDNESKQKLQNLVLSQIFSLEQLPKCKEDQPRQTFETIPKGNESTSSNTYDIESMQSPPETTFSGQLRFSTDYNSTNNTYNKQQLRNNLERIMQQKIVRRA